MKNYQDETYGDRIAGVYDEWYGSFDPAAIDTLAELAQGGPALELGIGTGRIALPLQERGVEVHGIDASAEMAARLHAKPGGERIAVTMGSFAEFSLEQHFRLVYVPFNTIFGLVTQEEQIRCFQSVAAHLMPGGVFLLECFVPDLCRFDRGQTVRVINMGDRNAHIELSRHDPMTQQITSQHMIVGETGTQFYPVRVRYTWPSELDLMARLAGLTLRHRWGGWDQRPFSSQSGIHISVYG